MKPTERIDRRLGLLFAGLCLLMMITLVKAIWIQGVQGAELKASARSQQVKSITIPGPRGAIIDRDGRPLAVSEDAVSVSATPYLVPDPEKTAKRLAPLLDTDEAKIVKALADRRSGFAWLARRAPASAGLKIQKMKIPGIDVAPDSRRVYPQGELATQVLGTVGIDNTGLSGLEASDDKVLRGVDGKRKITDDARGQPISVTDPVKSRPGRDVRLTIDGELQSRVEAVLGEVGQTFKPLGATAVVLDPRTCEVLAMANYPRVDANAIAKAKPNDLLNRATGFVYEPGSTFKAFTVSAALQDKKVRPNTNFALPPTLQVADRVIRESHARGFATMDVGQILAQSSNVGAVKIGLRLGARKFDSWIRRFGFGQPTGINFNGEERGIVPALSSYTGFTMGNLPIGQGLSVTPIQMAAGYSAIANGGVLRRPRLVSEVGGHPVKRAPGKRVISRRTSRQVTKMLEGVLAPGGTASEVHVPGYTLAGKTGTAEKVVDGTYSKTQYVASFVGYAPAKNPRLLAAVVVDTPTQGSYYGGTVAAPAFGEIASFGLQQLGVPPEHD